MNRRRIMICLLVVAALVFRIPAGVQGQSEPSSRLDLPAMALTPGDIEAFGLSGYGRIANGEFRSFDDYVTRRAEFLNVPEAELRSAFEDAGWRRGYVANLGLPAEPGDPESPPNQIAFSVVYEYADADGAATMYALNQDYDGVTVGEIELLELSQTYGDASFATRLVASTPVDGEPMDTVDVTLRRGNVIASAGLIALWRGEESATPAPLLAEAVSIVEQMATRLLERIDATVAGDSPGLSNRTLRIGGAGAPIAFSTEGYRRLNGDDPPYFNGYADDFPGTDGLFDEATAAYELNQYLQMPGDPYYVMRILTFSATEDAAGYVATTRAAGLSPAGTPAQDLAGAREHGDDSWTVTYSAEFEPGVRVEGIAVFAHVGKTALMLLLEGGSAPERDVVRDLATAQVGCLTTDTCGVFEDLSGVSSATAVP